MEYKKLKVLVLGASGMAGHTISIYFKERGHNVIGLSTQPLSYVENIILNVFDTEKLKHYIVTGNFDAVINCIGILNKQADDYPERAVFLNSFLPHFLSTITRNLKTKIIQMSTDCVFSGKNGNYTEHAFKDGETFYDRTKALGEIDNHKDLTFRNSIIGPDINEQGIGLFNWFMKQKGKIYGYQGAIWTGVTTLTLAKAMEQAIFENLTGIYNLVNNEKITKLDLLSLFNKHMKANEIEVLSDNRPIADKSLINTRTDFSFKVPSYEQMVTEMKDWIIKHQNLYPNYKLEV